VRLSVLGMRHGSPRVQFGGSFMGFGFASVQIPLL
jgi:hypothetical protein